MKREFPIPTTRKAGLATGVAMAAALAIGSTMPAPAKASPHGGDVDLVVLIAIDMLKGETPFQHYNRLTGGIRYLIDNGTSYTNAHYQHSTTFTAVGHAVLGTGAPAAEHGLAGNDWADRVTGERIYCVADPDSTPFVQTSIRGTSPKNLTATTFSDEIVLSSGGKSRTFGVSIKDRGAILPAGRLGKAFWYESTTGDFYTTDYYYDEMPDWVVAFNEAGHKDRYRGQTWELLHPIETYVFGHNDTRTGEKGYYRLGLGFPKHYEGTPGTEHHPGEDRDSDYYGGLRFAPAGDELTLDFVKELVQVEDLGRQGATDVLTISLSAQDYVGHAWGTHSLEYEDHFLRVDSMLGEFFDFLDQQVGLNRTLIILTADHASDDIPEYQSEQGLDAGRHYPGQFIQAANDALKERFGIEEDLIMAFWNPSLFLNPAVMAQNDLEYPVVERALADFMVAQDGFQYAVTRTDIELGNIPDTPIMRKLLRAFQPERSGNVLIIQDQFWYLYPNADQFAAMHGSPYAYDTHVPIMFAGPNIGNEIVHRGVAVSSIAPTVTRYLNVRTPSGADHEPFSEVLSQ